MPTKEMIFDIFNIARDGSNIRDDESADTDGRMELDETNTDVSFDTKAAEVADDLFKIPSDAVLPKVEKKEVPKENKEESVKKADSAIPSELDPRLFGDIFDGDEVKPTPAKITTPVVPTTKETHQTSIENTEKVAEKNKEFSVEISKEVVDAIQQEEPVKSDTKAHQQSALTTEPLTVNAPEMPTKRQEDLSSVEGSFPWLLNAPSPKFQSLYDEKRRLLSSDLLKGGEIPFEKFYEELHQASVDVNVPTFDTEEVGRRITEVQKFRDRVKYMQLRVNSQYFVWKEFMDLLPGILARIEYERGKQEGLVYEHLRDFKNYFGNLDGLHRSCESVCKHLDGAYASLSRQIAIAQPLQEVERFTTNASRPMTQQQKKYDALPNANKTGSIASKLKSPVDSGESQLDSSWENLL